MSASAGSDSSSSGNSSSSSVDGREEERWNVERPNSLQTKSSRSSSQDSIADTPSRDSIRAALDRYTTASKEGRQAFSVGKLNEAVVEFDQALDIELQTELECLYDTSIGLVSGLVRREVESRLETKSCHHDTNAKYSRILHHLREKYEEGIAAIKGGKHSNSPQWYLQMGASLVVINEWEKAKAVYNEGLAMCKEKKGLKIALKNLIKIEQMTSYADIPPEDQPDVSLDTPSNSMSPSCSPSHSPRIMKRNRSSSVGVKLIRLERKRERTSSLTLDSEKSSFLTVKGNQSPPVTRKEAKRSSFNFFHKRRSSPGLMNRSLSQEATEMWSGCFEPVACVLVGQTEFQPSAITHMRRLTSLDKEPEQSPHHTKLTFTPINQQSLRIEDDDSDMDP